MTGDLSEQDRDELAKRAEKMAVLVKNPERVRAVVEHIVTHFKAKVEPNGFKAQVVVFDRECCVLYKQVMDELAGPDASAVVMSAAPHDPVAWKVYIPLRYTAFGNEVVTLAIFAVALHSLVPRFLR